MRPQLNAPCEIVPHKVFAVAQESAGAGLENRDKIAKDANWRDAAQCDRCVSLASLDQKS